MYRLIYKSRCDDEINWNLIRSILHESEHRNAEREITGVLLASSSHFLQVIEGSFESVNETFVPIIRDSRHADICLISFQCVDSRLFDGWGMRGIGVFEFNQKLSQQLILKYGEEEGGVRFPQDEWLALSLINDIRMIRKLPDG